MRKNGQTVCDNCIKRETERLEKLKKKHKKIVVCCDCGEEFVVASKNVKSIRCDKCQCEKNKEIKRNYYHKNKF